MSDVMLAKIDHLETSMSALSKTVKTQGRALGRVERNGFGIKIDNINLNMERDREINEKAHARLEKSLGSIIKFGATSFITIFVVLLSILGSLWLQGGKNVFMEVDRNVPIVIPDSTSP